ncbi:MAG: hypothetical protein ACRCUT_01500, partial [Spirochaetota bacterium]
MRKIVCFMIVFCALPASAAEYAASAEYRRAALDAEEEVSTFMRLSARIFSGAYSSSGLSLSRKTDGAYSFTANALYDDSSSPVSVIAGHFYAQAGSGLLYGRLRPWNPDPFSVSGELSASQGFSLCTSSYPAYAFCGLGFSFRSSDGWNAECALSSSPRYIAEDPDHPHSA